SPVSLTVVIRLRHLQKIPALVSPLPYINFLRHLKLNIFKRCGSTRLLQVAVPFWDAMTTAQKRRFEPYRILARVARRRNAARKRRLRRRNTHWKDGMGKARIRRPIYDKRRPARKLPN
ncbi:hypothetical protein KR018_001990, partial [Drosophila ironensis]